MKIYFLCKSQPLLAKHSCSDTLSLEGGHQGPSPLPSPRLDGYGDNEKLRIHLKTSTTNDRLWGPKGARRGSGFSFIYFYFQFSHRFLITKYKSSSMQQPHNPLFPTNHKPTTPHVVT